MQNTVIIITDRFPYGKSESFLETELMYYDKFDRVIIFPTFCGSKKREFKLPNLQIARPESAFFQNKIYARLIACFKAIFTSFFWNEIMILIKSRKFNIKRVIQLTSFLSKAKAIYAHIDKWLEKDNSDVSNYVFYSYWMSHQALGAIWLAQKYPNNRTITRCHGFDLYERKDNNWYLPMRCYIAKYINQICCISENGKQKLIYECLEIEEKIKVLRLGTDDFGLGPADCLRSSLKIVSCSWLAPLKRIGRVFDALELMEDQSISWSHYGDGKQYKEMRLRAAAIAKKNIYIELKGAVSNSQILSDYSKIPYDVFVNVSDTEGIPVSIMEAISFGIPVIATDVGGTSEIVIDGHNGFLLHKDFHNNDLADLFLRIAHMPRTQYESMRRNARAVWQEKCNADVNFRSFVNSISM